MLYVLYEMKGIYVQFRYMRCGKHVKGLDLPLAVDRDVAEAAMFQE
jgi:hypothetical protein